MEDSPAKQVTSESKTLNLGGVSQAKYQSGPASDEDEDENHSC